MLALLQQKLNVSLVSLDFKCFMLHVHDVFIKFTKTL
jgi:hypothetical protein